MTSHEGAPGGLGVVVASAVPSYADRAATLRRAVLRNASGGMTWTRVPYGITRSLTRSDTPTRSTRRRLPGKSCGLSTESTLLDARLLAARRATESRT
ncbi:MAG: hypothetical protein NZ585_14825, partial [Chloracidobacterium sp.]|nr:hypothetical protein [Chloracidobacterium sp.]